MRDASTSGYPSSRTSRYPPAASRSGPAIHVGHRLSGLVRSRFHRSIIARRNVSERAQHLRSAGGMQAQLASELPTPALVERVCADGYDAVTCTNAPDAVSGSACCEHMVSTGRKKGRPPAPPSGAGPS